TDKSTKCPQCGGWIRKAQRIRRLGGVLIVLGLLLVGMMGTITIMLAPMMLSPGRQKKGSTFTGTPEQGIMILSLFGVLIVFGLVAMLSGIFQMMTGRRSIWIMITAFALAFLLWVAMNAVRKGLDKGSNENLQRPSPTFNRR